MGGFCLIIYLVGVIINKLDGDENIKTNLDGACWALVTFTTTIKGRLIASIWMITSIFLLSSFTAYLSSSLTVQKLNESPTTINDLYNSTRVISITGSISHDILLTLGINHKTVANLKEAISKINSKDADVIVHDKILLDQYKNDFNIWTLDYGVEKYAIIFPKNSLLREPINVKILEIMNSPFERLLKGEFL